MPNSNENMAWLAEQTREGNIQWEVRSRDGDGNPDSWSATGPDGKTYEYGVGQSLMDEATDEDEIEVTVGRNETSNLLLDAIRSRHNQ